MKYLAGVDRHHTGVGFCILTHLAGIHLHLADVTIYVLTYPTSDMDFVIKLKCKKGYVKVVWYLILCYIMQTSSLISTLNSQYKYFLSTITAKNSMIYFILSLLLNNLALLIIRLVFIF